VLCVQNLLRGRVVGQHQKEWLDRARRPRCAPLSGRYGCRPERGHPWLDCTSSVAVPLRVLTIGPARTSGRSRRVLHDRVVVLGRPLGVGKIRSTCTPRLSGLHRAPTTSVPLRRSLTGPPTGRRARLASYRRSRPRRAQRSRPHTGDQ
jgi:hypothetical protein